ncbi:unnamed protein product, partial [Didymodactylos carnosus]
FRARKATVKPSDQEEGEHEHVWDSPVEFVLSLISNSVGLGNVWRFPYLAAKNGGGAFLIPYFIIYFLVGAPLYFLELALGQFSSRSPSSSFILARGWRGVTNRTNDESQPATTEFFKTPDRSNGFENYGTPGAYSTTALLVAWIIVALCIIRGVKSTGKVAYFTAIFPYIVLLILIIQSGTLKGAREGVLFYITPKWDLVGNFEVWQKAASQVFFSLGLSFGSLIAYSSSNKFHNNIFRQCIIVVICDCFTGVFAGFAVFSTVGFLARELNTTVEAYADSSGPGLAFITYPEAITHMPAAPFFAVIFFLMLLALGLGSQFAGTDVVITAIIDFFPRFSNRRYLVVLVACSVAFLLSLPLTCPGGIYLFELLQEYSANISLVVVGLFEVIAVAYIYVDLNPLKSTGLAKICFQEVEFKLQMIQE